MVELEDIRFEKDEKGRVLMHVVLIVEPYEWPGFRELWDEMEEKKP